MPGVFKIQVDNGIMTKQLNTNNSTARKILQELKVAENLKIYKIQLNSHSLPIIGQFIEKPINIKDNGNYTMKYIEGLNLMDILKKQDEKCFIAGWDSKELKLNFETGKDILKHLLYLENKLHEYGKIYSLRGDWFLHNLIYDIKKTQIYNVDLEGFYIYYGNSPMCDLKKYIPSQFNACKKEILNQINSNIFTIILWNPAEKYYNEIENIIKDEFTILFNSEKSINNMKTFVDKVYELDVRCHKPYLPKKIEILEKYKQEVQFLMILIDNPKYDKQNVSHTAVKLKEKIRGIYKEKIENYYKDIIIHVADNSIEAENIFKLTLH